MNLPHLRIQKGKDAAIKKGCPWVFAGDIIASSELTLLEPGTLVEVCDARDQCIGIGYYNPHASLACRILTFKSEPIDTAFFERAFSRALARRKNLLSLSSPLRGSTRRSVEDQGGGDGATHSISESSRSITPSLTLPPLGGGNNYLRVLHAEADYVPGLIVDQFGDVLSVQIGTAGIERLRDIVIAALQAQFNPSGIIIRSDAPAHERVPRDVRTIGTLPPMPIEVHQNGIVYYADLLHGQKTGWYFDQRDNHALFAGYCEGKTVLDVYTHSGGFGLLAAARGATHVTMVDRSEAALAMAKRVTAPNTSFITGEAFEVMEQLHNEGKTFDCITIDPPPFIKTKQDVASGMKGYAKASFLGARLVAPGGMLMVASCSHHASKQRFYEAVQEGIKRADRTNTVLHKTGASADHPIHPQLPQTEYLKALTLRID